MSIQSKHELRQQVAPRYLEASHFQKTTILDEFVAVTGYARKYAIRLLAKPLPPPLQPNVRVHAATERPSRKHSWGQSRVRGKTPPHLLATLEPC